MNRSNERRAGFTLIELLVVVAIIAMLISILLPSLSRARESAKAVKCMANLRSQGMGMVMFSNDHGGLSPVAQDMARYTQSPRDPTYTYHGQLFPYLGMSTDNFNFEMIRYTGVEEYGDSLFYCPTTVTKRIPTPLSGETEAAYQLYCYGWNMIPSYFKHGRNFNDGKTLPVSIASMKNTSGAVAVVEMTNWYATRNWYFNRFGLMPHNEKSNFLFFDGHADAVSYSAAPNTDYDDFWSAGYHR